MKKKKIILGKKINYLFKQFDNMHFVFHCALFGNIYNFYSRIVILNKNRKIWNIYVHFNFTQIYFHIVNKWDG